MSRRKKEINLSNLPNIFKIADMVYEISHRLNYYDLCALLTVSKGLNSLISVDYRYLRKTNYLKSLYIKPEYIARFYRNKIYHKYIVGNVIDGKKPDFRKLQKDEKQTLITCFDKLKNVLFIEYRSLFISVIRQIKDVNNDGLLGRIGDETVLSIIKPNYIKYNFMTEAAANVNACTLEYVIYNRGYNEVIDEAIKKDNLEAYLQILDLWRKYCDQGKHYLSGYQVGCCLYNSFTGFAQTDAVHIFEFLMTNTEYQFTLANKVLPSDKEIRLSGRNDGMGDGLIGDHVINWLLSQGYTMTVLGSRGDAVYLFTH